MEIHFFDHGKVMENNCWKRVVTLKRPWDIVEQYVLVRMLGLGYTAARLSPMWHSNLAPVTVMKGATNVSSVWWWMKKEWCHWMVSLIGGHYLEFSSMLWHCWLGDSQTWRALKPRHLSPKVLFGNQLRKEMEWNWLTKPDLIHNH